MTPEERTALFTRQGEAYMRHDSVTLAADYAEDCVVESPLYGTLFGLGCHPLCYLSELFD